MASPGHRANILEPSFDARRRGRVCQGQRDVPWQASAARASTPSSSCRPPRSPRHLHLPPPPGTVPRRRSGAATHRPAPAPRASSGGHQKTARALRGRTSGAPGARPHPLDGRQGGDRAHPYVVRASWRARARPPSGLAGAASPRPPSSPSMRIQAASARGSRFRSTHCPVRLLGFLSRRCRSRPARRSARALIVFF